MDLTQLAQKAQNGQSRKRRHSNRTFFNWFSDNSQPSADDIAEVRAVVGCVVVCAHRRMKLTCSLHVPSDPPQPHPPIFLPNEDKDTVTLENKRRMFFFFWNHVCSSGGHFFQVIKDDMWPNPLQYFLAQDIDDVEENGVGRSVRTRESNPQKMRHVLCRSNWFIVSSSRWLRHVETKYSSAKIPVVILDGSK